ncbi:MAG: ankyrin repeat domain-containing protein [Gammaproteobacteria bacterium]
MFDKKLKELEELAKSIKKENINKCSYQDNFFRSKEKLTVLQYVLAEICSEIVKDHEKDQKIFYDHLKKLARVVKIVEDSNFDWNIKYENRNCLVLEKFIETGKFYDKKDVSGYKADENKVKEILSKLKEQGEICKQKELYYERNSKKIEEILEILLKKGSKLSDIYSNSPFYNSVFLNLVVSGQLKLANLVIDLAVKHNQLDALGIQDKHKFAKNTPLIFLLKNSLIPEYRDLALKLIKVIPKSHINKKDYNGNNAAHFACILKDKEIIEALHKKGADFTAKNIKGLTPVDYATTYLWKELKRKDQYGQVWIHNLYANSHQSLQCLEKSKGNNCNGWKYMQYSDNGCSTFLPGIGDIGYHCSYNRLKERLKKAKPIMQGWDKKNKELKKIYTCDSNKIITRIDLLKVYQKVLKAAGKLLRYNDEKQIMNILIKNDFKVSEDEDAVYVHMPDPFKYTIKDCIKRKNKLKEDWDDFCNKKKTTNLKRQPKSRENPSLFKKNNKKRINQSITMQKILRCIWNGCIKPLFFNTYFLKVIDETYKKKSQECSQNHVNLKL